MAMVETTSKQQGRYSCLWRSLLRLLAASRGVRGGEFLCKETIEGALHSCPPLLQKVIVEGHNEYLAPLEPRPFRIRVHSLHFVQHGVNRPKEVLENLNRHLLLRWCRKVLPSLHLLLQLTPLLLQIFQVLRRQLLADRDCPRRPLPPRRG